MKERSVAANGANIKYVGFISPRIRKMAVETRGDLIQYCGIESLERDERDLLCNVAIKRTPTAFNHIKKEFWPMELKEYAVKENPYSLIYLMHVSTAEMQLDAVSRNGMLLQHIKKKNRTLEMCRQAFQQTKKCFKFIPQKHQIFTE